jgi:hypothetical protein
MQWNEKISKIIPVTFVLDLFPKTTPIMIPAMSRTMKQQI